MLPLRLDGCFVTSGSFIEFVQAWSLQVFLVIIVCCSSDVWVSSCVTYWTSWENRDGRWGADSAAVPRWHGRIVWACLWMMKYLVLLQCTQESCWIRTIRWGHTAYRMPTALGHCWARDHRKLATSLQIRITIVVRMVVISKKSILVYDPASDGNCFLAESHPR